MNPYRTSGSHRAAGYVPRSGAYPNGHPNPRAPMPRTLADGRAAAPANETFGYLRPDRAERDAVRGCGFDPNGVGITTRGQTLRTAPTQNPKPIRTGTRNVSAKARPNAGAVDRATVIGRKGDGYTPAAPVTPWNETSDKPRARLQESKRDRARREAAQK